MLLKLIITMIAQLSSFPHILFNSAWSRDNKHPTPPADICIEAQQPCRTSLIRHNIPICRYSSGKELQQVRNLRSSLNTRNYIIKNNIMYVSRLFF